MRRPIIIGVLGLTLILGLGAGRGAEANQAPTIGPIANQTVEAGTSETINLTVSDPDGDSVTTSVRCDRGNLASISGTTLTLAPQAGDVGTSTCTVTARDAFGLTGSASFAVTVLVQEAVTITTEIHFTTNPVTQTPTGPSVTMGAFVHDTATVTAGSDIPANSSVDFNLHSDGDCTRLLSTEHFVLAGGAISESVESTTIGPLAVGVISYQAIFNSGDPTSVPHATSSCETLEVRSSITEFFYHLDQDQTAAYACTLESKIDTNADGVPDTCPAGTQEARVVAGTRHSYDVHVQVTNDTGLTILEKVQGGLAAGKGVSYSGLAVDPECGAAGIGVSRAGNVVVWNATGSTSAGDPAFTMTPGQVCNLRVTVTKGYAGIGEQPVTGSWSETQTQISPIDGSVIMLQSPGTGRLSVNVTP